MAYEGPIVLQVGMEWCPENWSVRGGHELNNLIFTMWGERAELKRWQCINVSDVIWLMVMAFIYGSSSTTNKLKTFTTILLYDKHGERFVISCLSILYKS